MQILVTGMHRSGTSVAARLVNMMGAYFGEEGSSIGSGLENPKGFWERRDVRDLNDSLLAASGAEWDHPLSYDEDKVPPDQLSQLSDHAGRIVLGLDAHRPWVIKEPRLSLTLPFWRRHLEVPVVVAVLRNPIEVARSIDRRNSIPVPIGIALWEHYILEGIRHSEGTPRVIVWHHDLIGSAAKATRELLRELKAAGVRKLSMPRVREIAAFTDADLHRARAEADELDRYLLPEQRAIWEKLVAGKLQEIAAAQLSAPSREALEAFAGAAARRKKLKVQVKELSERIAAHEAKPSSSLGVERLESSIASTAQELHRKLEKLHGSVHSLERTSEPTSARFESTMKGLPESFSRAIGSLEARWDAFEKGARSEAEVDREARGELDRRLTELQAAFAPLLDLADQVRSDLSTQLAAAEAKLLADPRLGEALGRLDEIAARSLAAESDGRASRRLEVLATELRSGVEAVDRQVGSLREEVRADAASARRWSDFRTKIEEQLALVERWHEEMERLRESYSSDRSQALRALDRATKSLDKFQRGRFYRLLDSTRRTFWWRGRSRGATELARLKSLLDQTKTSLEENQAKLAQLADSRRATWYRLEAYVRDVRSSLPSLSRLPASSPGRSATKGSSRENDDSAEEEPGAGRAGPPSSRPLSLFQRQAQQLLDEFHRELLPVWKIENEEHLASYPEWRGEREAWTPSVLVGTLYSGENELSSCRESVAVQSYAKVEHMVLEALPKKEAMSHLYETFSKSHHDLLIKLDADMVLLDRDFISNVVRVFQFAPDLTILQMAILDYFTGLPMQGINAYSKALNWQPARQHDLFTDRTLIPKRNRRVVWTTFVPSAIHAPSPSPHHAFHFGVHRALKVLAGLSEEGRAERAEEQLAYLERTWRHYSLRRDRSLLMACLGAELTWRERFAVEHLDYTDSTILAETTAWCERAEEEVESTVRELRSEPVAPAELQVLRARPADWSVQRRAETILFLLPHCGVFGGVNRFFELSRALDALGVACTVAIPDLQVFHRRPPQETSRDDYPDVRIISLSRALEEPWDVVVCGDYSYGLMMLLPLFDSGLTAIYLLNGWQYRVLNLRQIERAAPDVVLANSSYTASHYPELAPHVVAGGVNTDVFCPIQAVRSELHGDGHVVCVPGGRLKPVKRFVDAKNACELLWDRGVPVRLKVINASPIDLSTRVPWEGRYGLAAPALAEELCAAHMVVCPEEDAGWNNSAAEAMACGIPLICTPAGTTDFARHGETALVVPPQDPEAIAAAIETLIRDPERRAAMAKAGRHAIETYSWSAVARRFLHALETARIDPGRFGRSHGKPTQQYTDLRQVAG